MHITLLQMNVAVCKGIGQKEYITSGFCQSKQKINQKSKKKREPDWIFRGILNQTVADQNDHLGSLQWIATRKGCILRYSDIQVVV